MLGSHWHKSGFHRLLAHRGSGLLVLLLGALLLVACATVEAPGRATQQPEAITLGMGATDGSCNTTLCC